MESIYRGWIIPHRLDYHCILIQQWVLQEEVMDCGNVASPITLNFAKDGEVFRRLGTWTDYDGQPHKGEISEIIAIKNIDFNLIPSREE